ncbi:MAG: hypothetical protein GWN01_12140 [Nitrosopumilaceae archaeon]|nr:hypothetical protein [Nitrosopumilaceae archaeon]NIU88044.1 hypothetical protein [Nitrosopumilaceae archaeon]NIX62228.1 hypothetical protein [Nitrosopumilaceae archaeon]
MTDLNKTFNPNYVEVETDEGRIGFFRFTYGKFVPVLLDCDTRNRYAEIVFTKETTIQQILDTFEEEGVNRIIDQHKDVIYVKT